MTPEHEKLARTFSAKAFANLSGLRDNAIRVLYLNYGLKETQSRTGWTKPTILAAARKAAAVPAGSSVAAGGTLLARLEHVVEDAVRRNTRTTPPKERSSPSREADRPDPYQGVLTVEEKHDPNWLGLSATAVMVGLDPNILRYYRRVGLGPPFKRCKYVNSVRYHVDDVKSWMKKQADYANGSKDKAEQEAAKK